MTASLSPRDRSYALTGILLALFLGALDNTIVSTALPRIVADLGGLARYDWVATAYLLASTVLVPIYGKLSDLMCRKKIEQAAVGIFLAGSMLCGLSGEFGPLPLLGDGMNQLIAFRAVQGLGGAGLFAMTFIIIADLFPPSERGKYQGLVGGVFGIAGLLGPLVGGFLTDHATGWLPGVAGWRWVFYVNLPFGLVALWFISARMPSLRPPSRGRLDLVGAALLILGLVPLVLALRLDKSQPAYAWSAPLTLGLLAGAGVMLILFVGHSLRSRNPILDFTLFRNQVFGPSTIALFVLGASFMGLLVFLPLYLVKVVGLTATQAGMTLIPQTLGVVAGSVVAGQLVSRFGHYKRWMLGGLALQAVGILFLARMTPDVSLAQVTGYMVLVGLGLGPTFPLYTLAIQNAVDVRQLGQATSAAQFVRQMGSVLGVALMGTLFSMSLPAVALPSEGAALGGSAPLPEAARLAIAGAVSQIYYVTLGLLALGFLATLRVPEWPLRKAQPGVAGG